MSAKNQYFMKGPADSISILEIKLMAQALKKLCENLTGQKASLQSCLHQASKLFGFADFHHLSAYAKSNDIELLKASNENLKLFEIEEEKSSAYELDGFKYTMDKLHDLGIRK